MRSSLTTVVRALASGMLAWLLIQSVIFGLVHVVPGGPAAALAGDFATAETQAAVTRSFALDRPLAVQYVSFIWRMGQGDWGLSYHFRRPVDELIVERLGPTVTLMLGSLVIAFIGGRALGLRAAALRRGGVIVAATAAVAYALPVFWVGQLLLLGLGLELQWFPLSGMSDPRQETSGWRGAVDFVWHAVLPVMTLALQQMGFFTMIAYTKARQEIVKGYVRAAQSRGIPDAKILWGHVGRNVNPQLATAALSRIGMLFTGAVLVETLYAWPGLGRLLAAAILNRDHPVLLGVFGLITFTVILCSALADVAQAWLDPRITAQHRP